MKWNRDSKLYSLLEMVSTNNWKVKMYDEYIDYYISCDMEKEYVIEFLNNIPSDTFSYFYNPTEREIIFTAYGKRNWIDMEPTFLADLLVLLSAVGDEPAWEIKTLSENIIELENETENFTYRVTNLDLIQAFTDYIKEHHSHIIDYLIREYVEKARNTMNKNTLLDKLENISQLFCNADNCLSRLTIDNDDWAFWDNYQAWYEIAQEQIEKLINELKESETK